MANVPDISIVVPVYGSDNTLVPLYERVAAAVSKIPASFELVLVDDRGPGKPWEIICALAQKDSRVTGLRLARNFGQHSAIMAGVDVVRGNWLIIMDCDLQDLPEEIPRLWAEAQKGHDVVVGRRVERQDSLLKRLFSKMFHTIFRYMTDQQTDAAQSNFGIYSRKVVNAVKIMPEHPKVFTLLVRWAGFEPKAIDVKHGKRMEGKSSYNFKRRFSLAMDSIISYSNKPLKLCVQLGFFMACASFLYGAWLFIRYFLFAYIPAGWTSVMVSMFFLSGLLLLGMGILGIYIDKVFNQVKGRPLYVIDEKTNFSVKENSP